MGKSNHFCRFFCNFARKIENMLIYPNAKINIGLHVVERRKDGYHNLETVFYPIPLTDALEIHANDNGNDCDLRVGGTVLAGGPEDNLVMKAFRLLQSEFPDKVKGVRTSLVKQIPTGAGLGGGSSDGAFMLKALNERFSLGLSAEELQKHAAKLGADCPFFIENQPVLATGIGDVFTKISLSLKGKTLILVKPAIGVSTRDAYSQVVPAKPEVPLQQLIQLPLSDWKDAIHNDFERSVFAIYPEIAGIKDRLYDLGAFYVSMSGSGSAVFGLFDAPIEHIDEIFSGYFIRQRTLD